MNNQTLSYHTSPFGTRFSMIFQWESVDSCLESHPFTKQWLGCDTGVPSDQQGESMVQGIFPTNQLTKVRFFEGGEFSKGNLPKMFSNNSLGGGFRYFVCSPLFGEESHFD